MEEQPQQNFAPPAQKEMCIWSILSIIFAFLIPILGLVFGVIALVKIKETQERGKGLAIAGIVISLVIPALVLILTLGILFLFAASSSVGGEIDQIILTLDDAPDYMPTFPQWEASMLINGSSSYDFTIYYSVDESEDEAFAIVEETLIAEGWEVRQAGYTYDKVIDDQEYIFTYDYSSIGSNILLQTYIKPFP